MARNTPTSGPNAAGSEVTKEYYDHGGWKEEGGIVRDLRLFGVREDGPIKQAAHSRRMQHLLQKMGAAGAPLNLLECGCGGNPALALLPLCAKYTGIDFSVAGLEAARTRLSAHSVPFELLEGDICRLPFADSTFDAVYSANAIYHISDPDSQAAAYREALRVTRPGGVALFVMANPYPLAFPIRLMRRLAADTPGLGRMLNAVRPKPLIPYRPMSLRWTRRVLEPFGVVTIDVYAMASTWFVQNVSDHHGLGKAVWWLIQLMEERYPRFAGRLANYVQIMVRKDARGSGTPA